MPGMVNAERSPALKGIEGKRSALAKSSSEGWETSTCNLGGLRGKMKIRSKLQKTDRREGSTAPATLEYNEGRHTLMFEKTNNSAKVPFKARASPTRELILFPGGGG